MSDEASDPIEGELARLDARLAAGLRRKAGFPGAADIDYGPVWRFLKYELNNIGDPMDDPVFDHHTKSFEREAIDFFGDLLHAPVGDRWGYVTTGSTECLQFGLLRARRYYPDGVAFYSASAHYKVPRVLEDLRIQAVKVPASALGEISYPDLRAAIARHPGKPVIILATAGTTMTEAIDDVDQIVDLLDDLGVVDRYIHVDAALSGVPLAVMHDDVRPGFDFSAGADSVGFSLHKFLATRMPGGIVITRHSAAPGVRPRRVPYTGAADTTMTCSRNGHMALMAWYAVRTLGVEGMRTRADRARATATHLDQRLTLMNWPAWRHPHAMTVVLQTPPREFAARWHLATNNDGWSHFICLPGRDVDLADEFCDDLAATIAADPFVPVQPTAENGETPALESIAHECGEGATR